MPLTSESRFSFTDSYLTGLAETMRQRQMLDLDQSGGLGQKSVSFEELLWGDDEMFETNWTGLSEQPEETDFWDEVFQNDLLPILKQSI